MAFGGLQTITWVFIAATHTLVVAGVLLDDPGLMLMGIAPAIMALIYELAVVKETPKIDFSFESDSGASHNQ